MMQGAQREPCLVHEELNAHQRSQLPLFTPGVGVLVEKKGLP